MNSIEQIDKLIISICEYTQIIIDSDRAFEQCNEVAQNTKALAELLSARAFCDKDCDYTKDEIIQNIMFLIMEKTHTIFDIENKFIPFIPCVGDQDTPKDRE